MANKFFLKKSWVNVDVCIEDYYNSGTTLEQAKEKLEILLRKLMKKHTKIKSRNPIARVLKTNQFRLRVVKSKKPTLIAKYLDNKIKYDTQ